MTLFKKIYSLILHNFRNKFPKIFSYCKGRKSFVKFFVAGSLAATTDLVFLYIFYGLLEANIVVATSVAFLISFAVSFSLQKRWTFHDNSGGVPKQLILYLLNAFLSLNINGASMHYLVNESHIPYLLAQIIVNVVLGSLNFIIYKSIIFRNDNEDEINCEPQPLD